MDAEIVTDIILISFLGLIHTVAWAINVIWRLNNFHKGGLHTSIIDFLFLGFSTFSTAFLTIGIFTFLDNVTSRVPCLVFSLLFLGPLLLVGIKHGCFCIYIDEHFIVEKKLFSNVQINLKAPGTTIYNPYPHSKLHDIIVTSHDNIVIRLNFYFIEGNVDDFIKMCVKINNGRERL